MKIGQNPWKKGIIKDTIFGYKSLTISREEQMQIVFRLGASAIFLSPWPHLSFPINSDFSFYFLRARLRYESFCRSLDRSLNQSLSHSLTGVTILFLLIYITQQYSFVKRILLPKFLLILHFLTLNVVSKNFFYRLQFSLNFCVITIFLSSCLFF